MTTRYRNPYRVNYKKYEPYYSCLDCGEKFHDSNPLVEHRRSCRYKEKKLPPSSAGERLPYKQGAVCSTHTGATTSEKNVTGQTRGYAAELCVHLEEKVRKLEEKVLTVSEINEAISALLCAKSHDEEILELLREKGLPGNHPGMETFDRAAQTKVALIEKLERMKDNGGHPG